MNIARSLVQQVQHRATTRNQSIFVKFLKHLKTKIIKSYFKTKFDLNYESKILLQFYIRIHICIRVALKFGFYVCAHVLDFIFKRKKNREKFKKKENFENEKKHGIYSKH